MTPQLPRNKSQILERALARDLRRFYLFRLLATSYLYIPIFMKFQADRGLTFRDQLALGGIYSAICVIAEVPTGVFADRFGRRWSMLLGALAMVGSCVVALQAHDFATFAIAETLGALSMALCSGADSAYLFDLLVAHERGHDYARCESTASAWHLVGCAVAFAGGGALASVDLALPYVVTAVVSAGAAVIACLMRDDRPSRPPSPCERTRAWAHQTFGALAEVARNSRLAWIVGYSAVVFVLLKVTIYIYQPYLADRGLGMIEIGVLFAAVHLVAAFVAYRTHHLRTRFGDDRLLWGLLGVLAASFVGLAGAGGGSYMLALLGVQAIANGIYSPLTKPLLNREIADSSRRAAVLSVESMVRRLVMGAFVLLVGLYGQADVMMLCGFVGLAGLVVLVLARVSRAATPVDPS